MLKMIIADDERVIRETISQMLDWESLGIELIGVCKNGIEVYNMILDESPDIVMTDIRMPGLSGLEVVREIAQTNQQIQFIFLSGYEEFEYAREAMKYGVKYYLLKPCSESKMTEAICQAKEDCLKVRRQMEADLRQNSLLRTIQQEAMYHLLMEGMAWKDKASLKEKVDALVEIRPVPGNGKAHLLPVLCVLPGKEVSGRNFAESGKKKHSFFLLWDICKRCPAFDGNGRRSGEDPAGMHGRGRISSGNCCRNFRKYDRTAGESSGQCSAL